MPLVLPVMVSQSLAPDTPNDEVSIQEVSEAPAAPVLPAYSLATWSYSAGVMSWDTMTLSPEAVV